MTRYSKSIIALLGALATWGITAAEDNVYTQVELWGAVLAVSTALGVYAWPNRPPAGEPSDPNVSEQDPQRGASDVTLLVLGVLAVLLVLALLGRL